jgi:hypothetical protein
MPRGNIRGRQARTPSEDVKVLTAQGAYVTVWLVMLLRLSQVISALFMGLLPLAMTLLKVLTSASV